MTEEKQEPAAVAKAEISVETVGLEQRIEKAVNEYVEKKIESRFSQLEKHLDERTDAIMKAKEIEVEQALRKGFGLENDPVIHQSDLISAIRKAQLETAESAKKTPAPDALTKSTGPDGNAPPMNPFQKMVADYEKSIGVNQA